MSRVGKNPIVLPAGVELSVGEQIVVKGPLGTLKTAAHPAVKVAVEGQNVVVSKVEGAVNGSAMWGTMRANLNNMVTGVSKGFEKKLQLVFCWHMHQPDFRDHATGDGRFRLSAYHAAVRELCSAHGALLVVMLSNYNIRLVAPVADWEFNPEVSPDGRLVAYAVRSTDLTGNRGNSDLFLLDLAAPAPGRAYLISIEH